MQGTHKVKFKLKCLSGSCFYSRGWSAWQSASEGSLPVCVWGLGKEKVTQSSPWTPRDPVSLALSGGHPWTHRSAAGLPQLGPGLTTQPTGPCRAGARLARSRPWWPVLRPTVGVEVGLPAVLSTYWSVGN